MNDYYVYVYWRLDINEPFYVGKGRGRRWKRLKRENTNFNRIVNKYPVVVTIEKDGLTEGEAFYWEEKIIEILVFEYGYSINIKNNRSEEIISHLVNMTWGGEGNSQYGEDNPNYGNYWSKEQKESLSKKQKERFKDKENHPLYGRKMPQSQKEILSKKAKERYKNKENHPSYGKHHNNETKRKISEANKGKLKGENSPQAISVICITTKMIFKSMTTASEYYNIKGTAHLCQCCKGERKSCGKLKDGTRLKWKYLIWKHNKKYRVKVND